jgi:hypothetical protein
MVGRKLYGSSWRPLSKINADNIATKLNPKVDRVITMIAEQCEAGEIAAAYRSVTGGVDGLARDVWQVPHWRNYFATGTIELDLVLLDDNGRPNANGFTGRCTREVFVARQDLDRFAASLSKPATSSPISPKRIAALVSSYKQNLSNGATPSMGDLEHFAKEQAVLGHRKELRNEYHRQFPNQRVGRPSK